MMTCGARRATWRHAAPVSGYELRTGEQHHGGCMKPMPSVLATLGVLCVACSHSRPESAQPTAALPPPPAATVQGVAPGEPAPRTLDQMLAGKLAGVSVTPGPHGGIRVRMMGPTSFNDASEGPLFIVDGTQVEAAPGGDLPSINPR